MAYAKPPPQTPARELPFPHAKADRQNSNRPSTEHWGSGIHRMTAACRERGLDPPQFEEIGTHFSSHPVGHTPARAGEGRTGPSYPWRTSCQCRWRTLNVPDSQANRAVSACCPNASRVARRPRPGGGNRQRTTRPPSPLSSGPRCAMMWRKDLPWLPDPTPSYDGYIGREPHGVHFVP